MEIDRNLTPRWLHWWAMVTVCATLVLLGLGSIVTTIRAGMVDRYWPTAPWRLMQMTAEESNYGFIIEHSHRLAGYIVGCCTIVLAIGFGLCDRRRSLKWLGAVALALVIVQGLLGGFRVVLHAILGTNLAIIHGCFAQIVFSLLVVLAVLTSKSWFRSDTVRLEGQGLRRAATLTTGIMFAQIVAGAWLRHTYSPVSQRLHLLFAFAATAAVVWLLKLIFDARQRVLFGPAWILIGLLGFQVMLGAEAWLKRFAGPVPAEVQHVSFSQAVIVTAHVLIGFCLLATTVVITLWAFRLTGRTTATPRVSGDLEVAA